jgi:hypothetical protein
MRYVDAHDAGKVIAIGSASQSALEMYDGRPVIGAIVATLGAVSWIGSIVVSHRAFAQDSDVLTSIPVDEEHHRLGAIDYATGTGMGLLYLGVLNEVISIAHRSPTRMLAGVTIASVGVAGMALGGHFRPDDELAENTEVTTSLQVASDLLE